MGETVTIGGVPPAALIVRGDPANPVPGVMVNNSATSNLYLGNDVNVNPVNPNNNSAVPPNQYVSFDGTTDLYGIAAQGQTVSVTTMLGITSSPTTPNVTITGSPLVTISGTVPVNIQNIPTVNVGTVSGSINIAAVAGSVNVNGAVSATGVGGYIQPGQVASIFMNASAIAAAANGSANVGTFAVGTFASIVFSQASNSAGVTNSSVAAGAAICGVWEFLWQDASGNNIAKDIVSCLLGGIAVWEIPVRGAQFELFLVNPGTVGNVTAAIGSIVLDGSYRVIPNIRTANSSAGAGFTAITGSTVVTQSFPVFGVNSWVASIAYTWAGAIASVVFPLALWAGNVSGFYQVITTALAKNAIIADLTYALQNNVVAGATYPYGILQNISGAIDANPVQTAFNMPPTQCGLVLDTPAAGGQFFLSLVGVP